MNVYGTKVVKKYGRIKTTSSKNDRVQRINIWNNKNTILPRKKNHHEATSVSGISRNDNTTKENNRRKDWKTSYLKKIICTL